MRPYRLHQNGTYYVLDEQRVVLANAFARVSYRLATGEARVARTLAKRDTFTLVGASEHLALELRFVQDTLVLRVENSGDAPIYLDALDVLFCDMAKGGGLDFPRADKLGYFQHGWQSWSPTLVRALSAPEIIFDGDDFTEKHLPYGAPAPDERVSNAFTLIGDADTDAAMFLGFVSGANQFCQIRARVDEYMTRLTATAFADGVTLEPRATFESEPFMIAFGDAGALYEAYAERVAKNMGRRGSLTAVQGWCSWYYYFDAVCAADIRANVETMRAQNVPLDLVIVDDGYETAIGDWTSIDAGKFPEGMKALADEIHAAGKKAGIWLAPFGAGENSKLLQAHPEFLLRDENHNLVRAWSHANNEVYALDLTRADVQEWLRELFHTVCFEWGYDAVKLDFVFAGALAGKHLDAYATRAQAYRRGMQTIAKTLGAEKMILGCGAPQVASVGLVDSMRVSQDVDISWEPMLAENGGAVSTRHAIQNTMLRVPFNQRWWLNDPDCVMLRARGDVNMMTRHQARSLASTAALTGSILLDSDNLANLSRAAFKTLQRILPAQSKTARVRKWFSHDGAQPSELELRLDDGSWILASINWSKRRRETVIELPLGERFRVYDFWRKKDLGVHRNRIKIAKHAPHETIVLHCVPTRVRRNLALSHVAMMESHKR